MTPGGGAAGVAQVDPNPASQSQIQAAFEAAGVSNAGKWAKEVTEYGPIVPTRCPTPWRRDWANTESINRRWTRF